MKLNDPGMDVTKAPEWWKTKPEDVYGVLESLPGVTLEEIGKSAGGRPIMAASWGEKEPVQGRTSLSLSSAVSAGEPEAFFGTGKRERQVILFVGAAHGTEFEGTASALNYLSVITTGKDLRGREFPEMREQGRNYRFLFIPFLNIDGRERFPDHVNWISCDDDYFYAVTQGILDDEILTWPKGKKYAPMPVDRVEILGTYYNDNGINLVYDTAMAGDTQPENNALVSYARRELPDLVILSHSNNGSLVMEPGAFIPEKYKLKVTQIGAAAGMRCHKSGFSKSRITNRTINYAGEIFYHDDMIYHASGALPVIIEFPQGYHGNPGTHGELLEIGLAVLDEIACFGNRYGFKPS
jgi:hypothetical protein